MNKRSATERAYRERFLRRAAASNAGLVESAFLRHMTLEGIDRAALASALGCDPEGLDRMACSLLPSPASFDRDVAAIAAIASVDPELVAPILRRFVLSEGSQLAAEPPASYTAPPDPSSSENPFS